MEPEELIQQLEKTLRPKTTPFQWLAVPLLVLAIVIGMVNLWFVNSTALIVLAFIALFTGIVFLIPIIEFLGRKLDD